MRTGGLGFPGTKRKGSQMSGMRRAVVLAAVVALEGGSDASLYLERAAETLEGLLTRAGLLT